MMSLKKKFNLFARETQELLQILIDVSTCKWCSMLATLGCDNLFSLRPEPTSEARLLVLQLCRVWIWLSPSIDSTYLLRGAHSAKCSTTVACTETGVVSEFTLCALVMRRWDCFVPRSNITHVNTLIIQ